MNMQQGGAGDLFYPRSSSLDYGATIRYRGGGTEVFAWPFLFIFPGKWREYDCTSVGLPQGSFLFQLLSPLEGDGGDGGAVAQLQSGRESVAAGLGHPPQPRLPTRSVYTAPQRKTPTSLHTCQPLG